LVCFLEPSLPLVTLSGKRTVLSNSFRSIPRSLALWRTWLVKTISDIYCPGGVTLSGSSARGEGGGVRGASVDGAGGGGETGSGVTGGVVGGAGVVNLGSMFRSMFPAGFELLL